MLRDLPAVVVDLPAADRVCHGAPVASATLRPEKDGASERKPGMRVRIHHESGRLLAVGRFSEPCSDRITIEKVFASELT